MPKKFPDNEKCYRYREIEYRMFATVKSPAGTTLAVGVDRGKQRNTELFRKYTIK